MSGLVLGSGRPLFRRLAYPKFRNVGAEKRPLGEKFS